MYIPPMRYVAWLSAVFLILSGCAQGPKPLSGSAGAEKRPLAEKSVQTPPEFFSSNQPSREILAAAESKKGERAYKRESYRTAELHFRKALRMTPASLHALSGLGWTLYDSGRLDEAFPVFERAQALYPEDGSTRRGLAYLFYRYGLARNARELLGSLDKEKWPELANIDEELRERASRGFPPPRPPLRNLKSVIPGIIQDVLQLKPAEKKKESSRASIPKIGKPPVGAAKRNAPPDVQRPTSHNMVLIPGDVIGNGKATKVKVRTFRIDKFEVTNSLYAAFVEASGATEPPFWKRPRFTGPHLPVVGVTWHEARDYCRWARKRLPTEMEWEFAAGGSGRRRYPWGNRLAVRNAVFGLQPDRGGPRAVGRRPDGASVHGVEDLSGNVWEWVEDTFRPESGKSSPVVKKGVMLRTLRGGSWVNGKWAMTVKSRTGDIPGRRLSVYGFRCAADAP
jgi:formylglycine-generating enzyme required for sulfatase activity